MKPASRVVIAMLPHVGHYNPTFKLAHDLQTRGHAVTYVGLDDGMRPHSEAAGFAYASAALVPAGESDSVSSRAPGWWRRVIAQRRFVDALADGAALTAFMERLAPDVLLLDCNLTVLALSLQRFAFPTIMLNTQLPLDEEPGFGPLDAWEVPGRGLRARLTAKFAWRRHYAQRFAQSLALMPFGLSEMQMLRPIARAAKVDLARLRARRYVNRALDLPEIVLNPHALDVPRPARPGRHWSEACISPAQEQVEDSALETPMADERPLVLVSLGTVGTEKKLYERTIDRVVAAAARLRRLKFVIAGHPDASEPGARIRENVYAFGHIPQRALLARASVLVTHGGANGIKEAIVREVPMVVLARPGADWYANAARVAYHGLGFRRKASQLDISDLASMIEVAQRDPAIRARLRKMHAHFRDAERDTPAWKVLEQILDPTPPARLQQRRHSVAR